MIGGMVASAVNWHTAIFRGRTGPRACSSCAIERAPESGMVNTALHARPAGGGGFFLPSSLFFFGVLFFPFLLFSLETGRAEGNFSQPVHQRSPAPPS